MSTLAIILIVVGVLIAVFILLGFLGARARDRRRAPTWAQHVAEADSALEQARAADRGWDRDLMEEAARRAVEQSRPGWGFDALHLVLVDDRPGTDEDRAHFMAVGAGGDEARVVLTRQGGTWSAESVE